MRKLFIFFLLFQISFLPPVFGQTNHILGQNETTIVPERFLRGYDPITVFFNSPPMGVDKKGPEDHPEVLAQRNVFQLSPQHPGDYIWIDAKTLQFIPTIPWSALSRFTVNVQGKEHPLLTFMSEPAQMVPEPGSRDLEPLKEMTISFPQPLEIKALAAILSFEVQDLPGVEEQQSLWLTQEDFVLKQLERPSISDPVQYQLTFHKPVTYGKHVTLHLKLSLDQSIEDTFARYTFSTKAVFRVTGIGAEHTVFPIAAGGSMFSMEQPLNRGSNGHPLFIQFSDHLGPVSLPEVKQFVRFEPSIKNFRFEVSGRRLYLGFDSESDKLYKLTLQDIPLKDEAGRIVNFKGQTELYFYYPHADPFLRWKYSQGIIERYGPQQFPMEGRGEEQADMRVYKLDALDRNFWPFPSSPVEIDESERPPGPGEEPDFATNMVEHIQLLGSPLVSQLMPLPMKDRPGDLRFGLDLKKSFTRISGAGRPGTYLVGYRTLGSSAIRHYVRVQVTDLSLSTIEEESGVNFVVTSLKSGQPIAGASIVVEGQGSNQRDWVTVISGTTDSKGQYRYEHTDRHEVSIKRISVRYENDSLVLNPEISPPQFANNHWYNSRSTWLGWLTQFPIREKHRASRKTHIFTERPVYRPEEPVHIKGYIRYWREGRFELPPKSDKPVLIVQGPGNKQWSYSLRLTESASFYHKFDEKDLPTGDYTAYIEREYSGEVTKTVTFKKESYRIPRFEVNISGPDRVPLDRPFKLIMTADYYAGGKVVGQDATWQVTQYAYNFSPSAYPGFLFSTLERFSSYQSSASGAGVLQKTDKTDKNGSSEVLIDPSKEPDARPRLYIAEVTVRGADEQTVTTNKRVAALPPFVLGLKVDRFLKDSDIIKPQFLVLDHKSEPQAGMKLRLRVFQRQWHSYLVESDFTTGDAKYVSDIVDKPILERMLTSEKQAFTYEIPVNEAGVYIVEISAQDKLGRLQKVSADLFVAGDTPIAWEKPKAAVFETVLDKDRYDPGETAQLLLKSPFQNARALVVLEKPAANEYHWIDVQNGQGIFTLAITGDMTPSIPVHILLLRGRLDAAQRSSFADLPSSSGGEGMVARGNKKDRAKPVAMGSTIWVNVRPKTKQVKVAVEHPKIALPGTSIPVKILLNDPDGNPLNGEATLWLVDRAVLALGQEQPLDPTPSFLKQHKSYIRIRDIRNELIGEIPLEEMPGGDGARKRQSLFDKVTVRKNFKTVPYYNPLIKVVNGVAEVTVELPDNLTEFAIRAVATDGRERFGYTKSKIAVRLPLIVQSALPRFVRPGDRFIAGGIGRVVEGEGGVGRVELRVEGLKIPGKPTPGTAQEGNGIPEVTQPVNWVKDQAQQLYFPMEVTQAAALEGEENHVTIRMAVIRDVDGASDAFEIQLPVKKDRQRRQFDSFSRLKPDEALSLLAPEETPREGSIRQQTLLTYEPALIKMIAGLNYLAGYEHDCVEQRVSRLLPELALKNLLVNIGMNDRSEVIRQPMEETFRYLERTLKPNGLYSYWPGSRGYVNLTAYVVEFLLAAKEQGYEFNEVFLTRAIKALKESLRSDYSHFIDAESFTERIEALYTLAKAGEFDDAYAQDYLAQATFMNLYSEAKILETFLDQRPDNHRAIQRLREDLWKSLIFKLREGQEVYQGLQYRAQSWGGLINSSEVKTIAGVAKTLHKSEPQDKRVRLLVDELISRGEGDGWGSTNANAAALLALADLLETPQPPEESHRFTLTFDDLTEELNTEGKAITHSENYTAAAGKLTYNAGSTETMPFVWNRLSYLPAGRGDTVTQKNKGFVADRELLIIQADGAPPVKQPVKSGESIELDMGAIVEEHLRVVNPEDRYFVAVRAPFAAGFDPLNPNLATSPPEAKPSGRLSLEPDYALYEDDQVTFYYDTLPKGTYDFYFRLKTTFEGSFVHPAAKAELMYKQSVYGNSDGTRIVVKPRSEKE